jgi:hypothetical protein
MKFYILPNKIPVAALMLLLSFNIHSQERKEVFNSALWIKNEARPRSSSGDAILKSEQELKKYFNFNPIIDFSKDNLRNKFRNIVKKQSTVFVVFENASRDENPILSIEVGGIKTQFTSKKIQSDAELKLNKGNAAKGEILTYLCNRNSVLSKKKGSISIDDAYFLDRDGKNQMMELIYIPGILKKSEQNIIESYLSVKYGISLSEDADYYNSAGGKVWNAKENAAYSKRVTGIGRDDLFGLNQKQSGNYDKDGLYMALGKLEQTNADNKTAIEDKSFLMWGDNNQSTLIAGNDGNYKKMKRIWKTQSTGKLSPTQLIIAKDQMVFGEPGKGSDAKEEFVWLAIDTTQNHQFDYAAAKYIKSDETDGQFVFDNIEWKNDASVNFTFVKAADFFIVEDLMASDCNLGQNGKAKIKIVGGQAPFQLHLTSAGYDKIFRLKEDQMEFPDLAEGTYALEITDANAAVQRTSFTIDGFVDAKASMPNELTLDANHTVLLKPMIGNADQVESFEWYEGDRLLSTDKEIIANKPGNYKLLLFNKNGCKKSFDFVVREDGLAASGEWVVFPNPAKPSETFTIRFNLQKQENVAVAIHDVNGKVIKATELGSLKQFEYKDNLRVSGVYLIIVTRNGIAQTTKLIVE